MVAAQNTQCWLTGGNVARVAELAGAAGILVDGCIPDREEIVFLDYQDRFKSMIMLGEVEYLSSVLLKILS